MHLVRPMVSLIIVLNFVQYIFFKSLGFGGSIFGGLGQGSSSFCDGGFNFGGSPATPQQQQGSGGKQGA